MGVQDVLDKLMFWRRDTVDVDTDIEGCFTLADTLPETDGEIETLAPSSDPGAEECR